MALFSPSKAVKQTLDLKREFILDDAADAANGSNTKAFDYAFKATVGLAKHALLAQAWHAAKMGALVGSIGGYGAMSAAASGRGGITAPEHAAEAKPEATTLPELQPPNPPPSAPPQSPPA